MEPKEPNLVMYLFINKGARMGGGKIAAQAVQAAVGAYRRSDKELAEQWYTVGGHHTTLVMQADDEVHLINIKNYLDERGIVCSAMIDEGKTEVRAHTLTALATEIVDRNNPHIAKVFSEFKLYRDKMRFVMELDND